MSAIQKGVIVYNEAPINFLGEMLCLTDMWKAAGRPANKRPVDWLLMDATKGFLEFLAETLKVATDHFDRNQDVSYGGLIETKRGGAQAGTWGHWQPGFAYAKYLSHEFHAWVNQAAREKMKAITGRAINPLTQIDLATASARATFIRKAIALHGSTLAFNKRQGMDLTQARIKAVATVKEQMGIDLSEELGWQPQPLAVQERTMTATQIGAALGMSNRDVNQLLKIHGFHTDGRDPKGRILWSPTEKGRPFGRYEDKGKVHAGGTVQPWGWFPTIVDALRPFARKPEAAA